MSTDGHKFHMCKQQTPYQPLLTLFDKVDSKVNFEVGSEVDLEYNKKIRAATFRLALAFTIQFLKIHQFKE